MPSLSLPAPIPCLNPFWRAPERAALEARCETLGAGKRRRTGGAERGGILRSASGPLPPPICSGALRTPGCGWKVRGSHVWELEEDLEFSHLPISFRKPNPDPEKSSGRCGGVRSPLVAPRLATRSMQGQGVLSGIAETGGPSVRTTSPGVH